MAGLVTRIPMVGVRTDFRYSRFDGTIGAGEYRSVSFSKESSNRWRFELQLGDQALRSSFDCRRRGRSSVQQAWTGLSADSSWEQPQCDTAVAVNITTR